MGEGKEEEEEGSLDERNENGICCCWRAGKAIFFHFRLSEAQCLAHVLVCIRGVTFIQGEC